MNTGNGDFIGYEYLEIKTPENQKLFYLDCYESLGWEPDERADRKQGKVTLRRNRRISGRTELIRLQRQFEACMAEIHALEASKTAGATPLSLAMGIIGCAFVAGAVFAVTAEPPIYWLCVLLAIPGFTLWSITPYLHRLLRTRREAIVAPLIENKYEEIYEICGKGHSLISE